MYVIFCLEPSKIKNTWIHAQLQLGGLNYKNQYNNKPQLVTVAKKLCSCDSYKKYIQINGMLCYNAKKNYKLILSVTANAISLQV